MTSIVNDATSWVVGKIAHYPQQLAKSGIRQLTDSAIDALLPKTEASKFLKEMAPDLIMIIGDGLYKAVTTRSKETDKSTQETTTKENIPSIPRATLKQVAKAVHDAL